MRKIIVRGILTLSVINSFPVITGTVMAQQAKQFHEDKLFTQEYSVKYKPEDTEIKLSKVAADRNGYIQVFSSNGLLRPRDGQFLFPGTLVKDVQDRETSDKNSAS